MKGKLFLIFILSALIFNITGCESSKNDIKDNNDTKSSLTDEEKIKLDASSEKIYNQRIYLIDQQMIDNDATLRSGFDEDIEFLTKLKSDNLFASKFLDLYYKSDIDNILNNYTDIEFYLLFSYLTVKTNHCEGMCFNEGKINSYTVGEDYSLGKVYYRDKSFDSNMKPILSSSGIAWPCFIMEFTSASNPNEKKYVITNPRVKNSLKKYGKFYITYIGNNFESAVDYSKKTWVEIYTEEAEKEHEFNWVELDQAYIDNIINNNIEFLDFYIKYKNDIFYPIVDKALEEAEKEKEEQEQQSSKSAPKVGMTASQVRSSTWGSPDKINKDTYSWGTTEQWVYNDKGYIYFKNGYVTSISER